MAHTVLCKSSDEGSIPSRASTFGSFFNKSYRYDASCDIYTYHISERYNMNPELIKVVITDDDQVRIDGKLSPIGVMESRMFLQDPKYDVVISKHGLFRLGWQDRQGTPIGPQAPRPLAYDPLKHEMKIMERKLEVDRWHAKNPGKKMPVDTVKVVAPVVKQTGQPPAMKPHPIVNKGPIAPVTPHPITPSTVKTDKSSPSSVVPIQITHPIR